MDTFVVGGGVNEVEHLDDERWVVFDDVAYSFFCPFDFVSAFARVRFLDEKQHLLYFFMMYGKLFFVHSISLNNV